ncbi:amino acid ABC transporter permease [bacterium M00.F.Ca.ET.141.01.1.1]|uniref:amino acid ABC transporter permease n=1 Tax=unclassified Mesorhizobium TaxID=325217 RepID=UPI000FC9D2A3|nr:MULTISPECIES: amino acid ABC transporter permease [unclassified Mesorhizobium]TGV55103.1 amino acid ABC transporter permease [bacterium M00.F.Ca.ET.141.01.1.1]TIS97020.1 MAG: ABC transporter permease subunit [Mesorhizobium sp.]RUW47029.1 amino acid ABC transporter permease [Mesorhizobium sp. M8A.F.Ca.ET.021.01.1.1]TGP96113.1 amino acid ABC transporter permease [Mesorhizobium sp. M8A.F.Ca.ET.218.01.1.1]TGS46223.1 amino acid ABC transporter permease [Mesorhizobium sp. M8A.F.Ca.ET.182.01.1.1]
MQGLDFSVVVPYWDLLLTGAWWTSVLTVSAGALSFAFGILFAVIVLYPPAMLAYPVRAFMWVFMGTPLLLQLFLIYFGLVQIGIDIPALAAGIIGLGLHFAVYNADVIRAGIVAVDVGQTEGARSIGFGKWQALRYVVIPQAIRNTAPPIGGNLIALLKESSIVSVIGIAELVHSAQLAISETFRPFEFYITAAVLYYILNLVLEAALHRFERHVEVSR